ncbi:hypothetical protein COW36_09045 [bacterium (Candidatus Blackallbacteria) CG17_big_fil_post_rev_8_21_14_2_50_48_46]|uniref:DUF7210 domain-containing protein n=1 Tax=bacterium (Candidatus Blackallbacteria) CG17_big_fil_post_rev_8_21_14_2_50_48_46 TaxID=2014261 RepID=A0A2M7G5Q6_9BACT|nr:MAG: hypothetical protein COW64_24005 [bacterium (Candidatus Blackallbacteria) CG18_big_fil_WC_8_21_14_2_50_49_26]PIW17314.1 MAG: hypothetical protein COW36_09045 [bacterium (Candidatus Blackallbacteria) CG17_big_fil_post_rev_8_21_14_2_50_48_46]PIW47455.1 MAG: hypothetical protein COW20_12785 [bacterium (Candidatus Blackallbacteria) CG13_big_fil_rev_8_21_14_2_50_49_14]
MKVKVIIDSLKHDGEMVVKGDVLDLPKAQAQALLDSGAALEVDLNGVKTPIKTAKKTEADK